MRERERERENARRKRRSKIIGLPERRSIVHRNRMPNYKDAQARGRAASAFVVTRGSEERKKERVHW